MTDNVLRLWPEILTVIGWGVVCLLFAITLGMPHRPKIRPGSQGHRRAGQSGENEENLPDGYIDSFAGVIEEAGGGMPPVLKLALPAILICWVLYLIFNWAPK